MASSLLFFFIRETTSVLTFLVKNLLEKFQQFSDNVDSRLTKFSDSVDSRLTKFSDTLMEYNRNHREESKYSNNLEFFEEELVQVSSSENVNKSPGSSPRFRSVNC